MCTRVIGPIQTNLTVSGQGLRYIPLTPWLPAISIKYLKTLMELGGATDQFEVIAAIQTAETDTDSPGAWMSKGSALTADGKNTSGLLDVAANVDSKFFYRLGVGVKATSGTLLESGDVSIAFGIRS